MKKIWLILVCVLCLVSVVGGKWYWNHKLDRITLQAKNDTASIEGLSADQSETLIEKNIAKLPKELRNAAENAYKKNGQVRIVMIGSSNEQALALLLQKQLDDTFGEGFFRVTVQDLGKSNSLVLNQAKLGDLMKNVNGSPDLVIYTPFIYNDDRQVSTDDTETVATLLAEKVKNKYPKAAFLVNPPNYSSKQPYMNDRIDQMKTYIQKQKIAVLNYLSEWPKGSKRANAVGDDGHTMNVTGREIWIDYITKQWQLK